MKIVGMIPARYKSSRLPGKVLADIAGKPMIQHVYERAKQARSLSEVVVATDDERVLRAVGEFGGKAEMTSPYHETGTDRLAEVAGRSDADLIVNLQGDEPMMDPQVIEAVVAPFLMEKGLRMGTVATPIRTAAEHLEDSTVKVVLDGRGYALYFSRAPIPYFRVDGPAPWSLEERRQHPRSKLWPLKHLGLYAYTKETLLWLTGLKPTPLEQTEKLEQLRALENGCPIRVVTVDYSAIGVDTEADLEAVRRRMEGRA
jgi:3-deoxy-manno-octulosonate cytidylyltransferase (CMP-KDO synthetase)